MKCTRNNFNHKNTILLKKSAIRIDSRGCGGMARRNSDYRVYPSSGEAQLGNPVIDEVSYHCKDCREN